MSKADIQEIEKAKKRIQNSLNDVCFATLYSQEQNNEDERILLQYIDQLEQENINLKIRFNNVLDKNKKYCFIADGNTEKCLGYSNINDDEPCEYCKSCEALSIKGDD